MKTMRIKKTKVCQKYYTTISEEMDQLFHNEPEEWDLTECAQICVDNSTSCDKEKCKHWISFDEDNNCDLISIKKHGPLTLRQVGERMGISYVRIKQIEDDAIKKIRKTTTLEDV